MISTADVDRGGTPVEISPAGVFVLGMARSGTSALTRLITLLGPSHCVADDLIPPRHYNPLGFYESRSLQVFNHVLLSRWSADGWRDPRLPAGWQRERGVRLLQPAARRMFAALHPTAPWVFKDSSLNHLLPFWTEALGCRPDVVLIYRHPAAVARSLERDARIPFERCVDIWERQNRAALANLRGLPVFIVGYDDLVEHPQRVAETLADWLRGRGYAVPAGAELMAGDSIDVAHRHWRREPADEQLPPPVKDLLAVLEQRRGTHACWDFPSPRGELPPSRSPRETLTAALHRVRWWWWVAEQTLPAPMARAASSLRAPRLRPRQRTVGTRRG
jgi:hypothetical protein